jgi:hypothetical protein
VGSFGVAHDDALPLQQDVQPSPHGNCEQLPAGQGIAEATTDRRQFPQTDPNAIIVAAP